MNNTIGLNIKKVETLAGMLNDLLANYEVFYQNLRHFHWNIKGKKFFELHLKFEEFYTDAFNKIDEIAERVLTLQHVPLHTYEDYLAKSDIKSVTADAVDESSVKTIVEHFSILISKERAILEAASEAGDEGTVALMSDYITTTEKTVWMLNAFLG
ncbi:MAG: DNA starvation/stationary phase protection protein [Flavobacteriales bacterium]|nr:MAG: DNA starvation/stationary phase protection protein [Flavobacteriales bacterium]